MSELTITCPAGAHTIDGASRSGDYRVSWTGPDGAVFRLVEYAGTPSAEKTIYQGTQNASTVTGRPQGDYFYRVGIVRQGDVTRWSTTCEVKVRPYPLEIAFLFFGFGLAVTLATVLLVVLGHRAHRRRKRQ